MILEVLQSVYLRFRSFLFGRLHWLGVMTQTPSSTGRNIQRERHRMTQQVFHEAWATVNRIGDVQCILYTRQLGEVSVWTQESVGGELSFGSPSPFDQSLKVGIPEDVEGVPL